MLPYPNQAKSSNPFDLNNESTSAQDSPVFTAPKNDFNAPRNISCIIFFLHLCFAYVFLKLLHVDACSFILYLQLAENHWLTREQDNMDEAVKYIWSSKKTLYYNTYEMRAKRFKPSYMLHYLFYIPMNIKMRTVESEKYFLYKLRFRVLPIVKLFWNKYPKLDCPIFILNHFYSSMYFINSLVTKLS